MNFSIDCCCNRKNKKNHEMSNLKEESIIFDNNLSDIYELVMTPCDNNSPEMPETRESTVSVPPPKRKNVYVNFFEDDSPLTPRTPDANSNTFHVMIPKGSNLYVNYEKVNNFT